MLFFRTLIDGAQRLLLGTAQISIFRPGACHIILSEQVTQSRIFLSILVNSDSQNYQRIKLYHKPRRQTQR